MYFSLEFIQCDGCGERVEEMGELKFGEVPDDWLKVSEREHHCPECKTETD